MKIAITIYPDDFAEADRIIHQLRGVRSLELDGYMGKASYDKNFDKQKSNGPLFRGDFSESENEDAEAAENSAFTQSREHPNVNPGEPSISKIGSNTKEELLSWLKNGMTINRAKFGEHLKLLWKRGEVKFDGEEYYL